MSVVNASFKPEFLNRLDDVIMFDALSVDELSRIVELQVASLQSRLTERRLTLEVTDAARAWLAMVGYDPAYGARPLRRLVQRGATLVIVTHELDALADIVTRAVVVRGGRIVQDGPPGAVRDRGDHGHHPDEAGPRPSAIPQTMVPTKRGAP